MLPRLRRNLQSGDTFLEYAGPQGLLGAVKLATITGCGEVVDTEGSCVKRGGRVAVLHLAVGLAVTVHSYHDLADLVCPEVLDEAI